MEVDMEKKIRVNEWIDSYNPNFKYKIFWPYKEELNVKCESVDVYCRLDGKGESIGTFMTLGKIDEMMKRFKRTGENEGLFVPMGCELIVERISNNVVQRSIASLLEIDMFSDYFKLRNP